MDEKFPNLRKETDIQIQETERNLSETKPRRSTQRLIVIKIAKCDEEKKLKQKKKRQLYTRDSPIRLSADFSAETLQAKKEGIIYSKG